MISSVNSAPTPLPLPTQTVTNSQPPQDEYEDGMMISFVLPDGIRMSHDGNNSVPQKGSIFADPTTTFVERPMVDNKLFNGKINPNNGRFYAGGGLFNIDGEQSLDSIPAALEYGQPPERCTTASYRFPLSVNFDILSNRSQQLKPNEVDVLLVLGATDLQILALGGKPEQIEDSLKRLPVKSRPTTVAAAVPSESNVLPRSSETIIASAPPLPTPLF